jgi:hypothetical protein
MGIREVLTAPRCPWQNPYVERFIGSLRRECLDHIIVFNESSLRPILKDYFEYYEHSRTHLALEKDAPASRAIQAPDLGTVLYLKPKRLSETAFNKTTLETRKRRRKTVRSRCRTCRARTCRGC